MARLEREVARDADSMDDEDEAALQEDIEEDQSVRQSVNIYKSKEDGVKAFSFCLYPSLFALELAIVPWR